MTYKATAISLIALAAAATSAAAQTTNKADAPAAQAKPSATAPAGSAGAADFIKQAQAGQWRASKLVGVDIYGPNNAKVGDVDEVMIDQNGSVVAVVIGVGGFLGMGAKDVALPMKSVRWEMTAHSSTTSSGTGPGASSSTSSSTSSTSAANTATADRDYPAYGIIQMTKDQLQNAPTFQYVSDTSSATAPTSSPATTNRPATSRP